ncbi:MAG: hypothetical protein CVU88_07415 [Firmicutes bacterium HGW-Firmicutes-13]|nr:MAG: hypothetical protein CVU88_07415 [Firmicutes bacterium HGW-Firmicutes-13]
MYSYYYKSTCIVFVVLIVLTCLSGCTPVETVDEAIVLPVLFYHMKDAETIDIQVGHIDCIDGVVQYYGETVYNAIIDPTIRKTYDPTVWDGKRIIIPKKGAIVEPETPVKVNFIDPDCRIQYGKDCQVEILFDNNGLQKAFINYL